MAEYEYIANPKAPYEVLQTHVLPYDDVRMLKHFEDVFERFYNSERYRTVFGYISESLIQEGSAFAYFEEMTKLWLEKGNQERKLNDADQIAFLYEFFTLKGDQVACDLLRYDVLTSFNGKIRDERFGLSKDRKQEMQDAEIFWREESLVQQYIPNYSFVEWRRIRQDYHTIEVCGKSLPYLRVDNFDDSMTDTVIADNRYAIIIDVKGDTKPFIRPDIHGVFPELSSSPLQQVEEV